MRKPSFVHYVLTTSTRLTGNSARIIPKRASNVEMSSVSINNPGAAGRAEGVLMILSPAKTLDLTPCYMSDEQKSQKELSWTIPECSESQTQEVATAMKKRKEGELGKLLGISSNLSKVSHGYWSAFEMDAQKRDESEKKPAIYAFMGAAYQGLEASTCSENTMVYLQNHLRIIDPLYGTLRPLDVIQPYRLEMATRNVFPQTTKLADWWKPAITQHLAKDLQSSFRNNNRILVNLASDEYSAAVDGSGLPEGSQYIKVVFWEEGRVIAVHAKRARGLMVRYLAENNVMDLNGIQNFSSEGYRFIPGKSDETKLVFDRKKQPAAKKKKKVAATPKKEAVSTKKAAAAAATLKANENNEKTVAAASRSSKRTRTR